jgi:ABC-type uncharacterized transport system permease subunit
MTSIIVFGLATVFFGMALPSFLGIKIFNKALVAHQENKPEKIKSLKRLYLTVPLVVGHIPGWIAFYFFMMAVISYR